MLGTHYTPQRAEVLRHALGLGKPVWEQYGILCGTWRTPTWETPSLQSAGVRLNCPAAPGHSVAGGYAAVLAVLMSIPLATISALRRNGPVDQVIRTDSS
jgi:ABC-type dipeptide/oligopeptide/nickel transport system permease component